MSWQAQGMRAWVLQRFSAVYIAIFCLAAALFLLPDMPTTYIEWRALFTHPVTNIACLLFMLALLAHAWVGMRDIIIDYVHPFALRLILMTGLGLLQIVLAIWITMVLFSLVTFSPATVSGVGL